MSDANFEMPQPSLGDTVLFSMDLTGFGNPAVGWVTQVGDTTINILTFTPGGFVERHSVHHRSDPSLHGDHGWQDLGCWDFAPATAVVRELAGTAKETRSSGRATGNK